MNTEEKSILLNVAETAEYLNLGLTKTRELMKNMTSNLLSKLEIESTPISNCLINGCLHR